MSYKVIGTVRANPCNKDSATTHLVVAHPSSGATVYQLGEALKSLADSGNLVVDLPGLWPRTVRVQVFKNNWGQWIARTEADDTLVNNLDRLPVYHLPQYGAAYYQQCPL